MDNSHLLEFERGYRDATDEDDWYRWCIFDLNKMEFTDKEIFFESDLPKIDIKATQDEVIDRMESKGWEHVKP